MIPEDLAKIRRGDVLTLKTALCGYYQVKVSDVGEVVFPGDRTTAQLKIRVNAFRYHPEEPWKRQSATQVIILDTRISITNETRLAELHKGSQELHRS